MKSVRHVAILIDIGFVCRNLKLCVEVHGEIVGSELLGMTNLEEVIIVAGFLCRKAIRKEADDENGS